MTTNYEKQILDKSGIPNRGLNIKPTIMIFNGMSGQVTCDVNRHISELDKNEHFCNILEIRTIPGSDGHLFVILIYVLEY